MPAPAGAARPSARAEARPSAAPPVRPSAGPSGRPAAASAARASGVEATALPAIVIGRSGREGEEMSGPTQGPPVEPSPQERPFLHRSRGERKLYVRHLILYKIDYFEL